MSDYWAAQQRHWCKYCKKYVANNKPSIALHENGRSHKDEVERFLRGVYQKGRKDIEDAAIVKEELERIERAAMKSMGQAYVSNSTPTKKSYDYYIDPTVPTIEELREQALAEKEQTKATEGREEWAVNTQIAKVGEWETVAVQPSLVTETIPNGQKEDKSEIGTTHDQAIQFQDEDEDEEDLYSFKIKEKELDIPIEGDIDEKQAVTFKKRKLGDSAIKSRKKKPLRKKD